jgi:hypothetical protein
VLEALAHLRRAQPANSLWPQCAALQRGVLRFVCLEDPFYHFERPHPEPKALFRSSATKGVADARFLYLAETDLADDKVPLAASLASLQLGEAVVLYSMLTFTKEGRLWDTFVLLGIVPWFAAPVVSLAVSAVNAKKPRALAHIIEPLEERLEWRYVVVNSALRAVAFDPNLLRIATLLQRAPAFLPLVDAPTPQHNDDDDDEEDGDSQFILFGRSALTRRLAKARAVSTRIAGGGAAADADAIDEQRPIRKRRTTTTQRDNKSSRQRSSKDTTAADENVDVNDDDNDDEEVIVARPEDVVVTMFERVDLPTINYLLEHPTLIKQPGERSKFRRFADAALRHNGLVPIRYVHRSIKPHWGRLQAIDESGKQSSSFQGLKRELSNTLAWRHHIQLDIANAHPTIALSLARAMGMQAPTLARYVEDRERLITEAGNGDRDRGKNVFLVLMFGGNPGNRPPLPKIVWDYRRELKAVAACVYADNAELVAAHNALLAVKKRVKNEHQRIFSFFGYYVQHIECQILLLATEFMRTADAVSGGGTGWTPRAFKHDGFLVEKRADIAEPAPETLARLSAEIEMRLGVPGVHFKLESLTDERLPLPVEYLT